MATVYAHSENNMQAPAAHSENNMQAPFDAPALIFWEDLDIRPEDIERILKVS